MITTRASRNLVTPAIFRPLPATTVRQCAVSRCYATKPSNSKSSTAKPNPKATAAKLNNVRKKAASRKNDLEENDSLAARTPLKRPSADGLGVPSPSPSSGSSSTKSGSPPPTETEIAQAAGGGQAGIADAEQAKKREEFLSMARQARKDNEREELEKKEGKKEYEEKKRRLKGGYMRVVIGLPIMGVLSWELWERLVGGKQQKVVARDTGNPSL